MRHRSSILRAPRRWLRLLLNNAIRKIKTPRMVYGYRDASGAWRSRTRISDTTLIYHPQNVRVADNVFIWHYSIIDGTGGLEIGEGTQIGAWVGIFTHSSHIAIRLLGDHYQEVAEYEKPAFSVKPTKIGRYVFIGAGAKILPGITIGDGALISAGAIVNKNVDAFAIVAGNPGKVMGDVRKMDAPYLEGEKIRAWYLEWQNDIG
jgi:acetyltransferase-like isoleucine patch superfamily enzyme